VTAKAGRRKGCTHCQIIIIITCSGGTGSVHRDAPIIAARSAYVDAGRIPLVILLLPTLKRRERKSPSYTRVTEHVHGDGRRCP
jgi:hypothetical protein